MVKQTYGFVWAVCCVLSLSACERAAGPATGNAPAGVAARSEPPPHAVEVVVVSRQAIRLTRTLTGTLEAPRRVRVHSQEAGRIIDLPFHEGDRVRAGAMLVRLDDALIRADLAKAVATRKQTEVNLNRLKNLVSRQLATEDELARAQTSLELAQAEETLQRTLLSRTVIEAPFDGVVSERLQEPSDVVAVNDHILTLFDPDFMTVTVQVPEQLHSRIAAGDSVQVRIDSLGERDFAARILRIHPEVDVQTRLGTVEIRLDPVPRGVRPGQLSRVTLESAAAARRVIPLNALQFDTQGSYVFQLSADATVVRTGVVTGLQIGDGIEIVDGISEGDQIVIKGFLGLKPGKVVKVVNAAAPIVTPPAVSPSATTAPRG